MEKQITPITAEKFFNLGKSRWPKRFDADFHNAFYFELEGINNKGVFRENGCMTTWWHEDICPKLDDWNALRPSNKLDQTKIKTPCFWKGFKDTANKLRDDLNGRDITSDTVRWKLCKDLFDTAHEIKPVKSPTFPAKLCHFIFPALFPVSDLKLVGIDDAKEYPDYWHYVQGCWLHSKAADKRGLKDDLRAEIKKHSKEEFPGYPFACKIGELHVIGQNGWSNIPSADKG